MKAFLAFLSCLMVAQGHYIFVRMALNDNWFPPQKYIRERADSYEDTWDIPESIGSFHGKHRGFAFPTYPLDSPESIRCGRDNMAHAATTETLDVQAGDNITFMATPYPRKRWDVYFNNCTPTGNNTCSFNLWHGGPVQAYLSPIPSSTDITKYDGSGEWVKIYTLGYDLDALKAGKQMWKALLLSTGFKFQLPQKAPPGQYLLRIEQIYPRALPNPAQIYLSCAHIHLTGSGGATLPKGVKIPEDIPWDHPGVNVTSEMENEQAVDATYVYPGGPLWDGN